MGLQNSPEPKTPEILAEMSEHAERYRFETCLAEYQTLRDEIHEHMKAQMQIVGYAIVIIGGVVPFVVSLLLTATPSLLVAFLLGIPALFSGLFFLMLATAYHQTMIGNYIQVYLRPTITSLIKEPSSSESAFGILQWETYQWSTLRDRPTLTMLAIGIPSFLLLELPSIVSMGAAFWIVATSLSWTRWFVLVFAVDILLTLIAVPLLTVGAVKMAMGTLKVVQGPGPVAQAES